jgi:hypothetical protein
MEKVLKLTGAVPEIGDGKTDLASLERRLEQRQRENQAGSSERNSPANASINGRSSSEPFAEPTPNGSAHQSNANSPKNDNEVEVLSDMMCSLVTNCGETRFLGNSDRLWYRLCANRVKGLLPGFRYLVRGVYSGLLRRLEIRHSKTCSKGCLRSPPSGSLRGRIISRPWNGVHCHLGTRHSI